jgi:hypothetical protein
MAIMKINIELSGALKRKLKENKFEFEAREGQTIKQIILELGYKEEEMRYLIPVLNSKRVDMVSTVKEGDHLKVLLPIGGG